MKEIRQVYVAQKKKEFGHHFMLVGIAIALLGVSAAVGQLKQLWKKE